MKVGFLRKRMEGLGDDAEVFLELVDEQELVPEPYDAAILDIVALPNDLDNNQMCLVIKLLTVRHDDDE